MSRKDYVAVAAVIASEVLQLRRVGNLDAVDTVYTMTKVMADVFGSDNPRFDRDRFLAACGFEKQYA
jgi:hypothetical protein